MTPVVVSRRMPAEQRARLREALLGLAGDAQGTRLLAPLRIERFAPPPAHLFDSAFEVVRP
jgi:ABC-type phosphate/phosphonate transport system substrate-binding protein